MYMFHIQNIEEIEKNLNTSRVYGLTDEQAREFLKTYGYNELPKEKRKHPAIKFLEQFKSVLVLILIAATIVSYFIGEKLEAGVILTIVIVNAAMGYIQESKAEKAIEALKKLSQLEAKVIRNGRISKILIENLVPGDLIILETGDKVPADCILTETVNLEISESILTGESKPIRKNCETLKNPNLSIGDRINMAYKDTSVLYGRGKAIVIGTGISTEIGKISKLIQSEKKGITQLEIEINKIGRRLSFAALVIIGIIFVLSLISRETNLREAFMSSVSLAVAAIPESLPTTITIVLAIGVSRLAKSKATIRKLHAVETLGSINYILTDKTGTLTQNKMAVSCINTGHNAYKLNEKDLENLVSIPPEMDTLIKSMVLCNDAQSDNRNGFLGDPTETALLEGAIKLGANPNNIRGEYERIYEIPFSSENKKMIVVVKKVNAPNNIIVLAKGAAEVIANMVTLTTSKVRELDNVSAQAGLRNLAFSYKEISKEEFENAVKLVNPQDILSTYHTFLGIVSQKDPLRPGVKEALKLAKSAGIETLMLTGDHKLTATNIAMELGLIEKYDEVMDGSELGDIKGDDLIKIINKIKVFARVSPEQKLRITQAVKSLGNTVAVTGDGINDAPAIKAADIGISMGISGTDVSKEVSDMVLQDDNYATIVEAVRQGRIVYDNFTKFIKYLVSCNISEIAVIGFAVVSQLPTPLLPIHILWINLVTDGLPALSLGMEPGEKNIMLRKPRKRAESILNFSRWLKIFFESFLISTVTIAIFIFGLRYSIVWAQSAAMTTLALAQLAHSLNNRSEEYSIFSRNLLPNGMLYKTIIFSILIQAGVIYTSLGNRIFKTIPLELPMMVVILLASLTPLVIIEILKKYQKTRMIYKI